MNNTQPDKGRPLLQLVDGAILDFSDDYDADGGCETCDYGSRYVREFTVKTTDGDYRFDLEAMYEYPVSQDFLMRTIPGNAEAIKAMTITGFVEWLTDQFARAEKENYLSDFKFKHYKVGENG